MHPFNTWAFGLIFFLQASSVLAAATLRGVVLENQVGGGPVKNIQVSAAGAHPASTGTDGQFVLHFPEHQPGEEVTVKVARSGWVVVNDIQLTRALLPANTSQSSLEILISKETERLTWAMQFYRLQGQQVVDVQYKNRLAELEGRNAAGSEERARLLRERDEARAQVDELARQIATRPAGSGNEDNQKAVALFLDGRMDEALDLLSEERLRKQAEDARKQAADAKKLQEKNVRNWLRRGQMLAVKFDFDGAASAYGEVSPDSYDAWFAYVEALKLYRYLAQKNPDVYFPKVAMTLNNLGILHRAEKRMEDARQAYEEALKLYRALAQKNPDVYFPKVAMTLNNLGALLSDENRMGDARQAYEEALKIYRTFAKVSPATYEPYAQQIQVNLNALPESKIKD